LNSFPMYVCSTHTIFERTKKHLVAFIEIAFISILSRRLARIIHERCLVVAKF